MLMPGAFSSLRWFGRGPHENYPDRKSSAVVGTHASTVSEQFTPYIRPGECGARSDVRWLELTRPRPLAFKSNDELPPRPAEAAVLFAVHVDGEGEQENKSGKSTFSFSALPYLAEDLSRVAHPEELPRTRISTTAVSLDHCLMGVGGDDSWSACVHDEFLVRPGLFKFAFAVAPYWREIDRRDDDKNLEGSSGCLEATERWRSLGMY